jgi:hypothetical protein
MISMSNTVRPYKGWSLQKGYALAVSRLGVATAGLPANRIAAIVMSQAIHTARL